MKAVNASHSFLGLAALAAATLITSCSKEIRHQPSTSEERDSVVKVAPTIVPGSDQLGAETDMKKIDMGEWYKSGLKQYGVDDVSTGSLIRLLDNENPVLRFYSASLLGERKESAAIPRLERALADDSLVVQKAATKALLQMGNRKGIKVMEDFCAKASAEYNKGDFRNTVDMMDAAELLAKAGEVSAIPYLRQLLGYQKSWGVRLIAVRSLRELYEKEPAVLTDIASKLQDENAQIRREVSEILQNIQSKPSVPSGQQRK